jgi:XTP/dITP diphosphohydrolase
MSKKIVLASNNEGKLREIEAVLDQQQFRLIQQSEFNVSKVEEIGTTFVENAIIKARHAAQRARMPALSDDSGIVVDALHGAPGVCSARYAGDDANDVSNNTKLLQQLVDIPATKRTARFQCVIVYMRHAQDPIPLICQGTWEGAILYELKGPNGFGYDPLFYVPTHDCSSAELDPAEKNRISHRAQALQKLIAALA